MGQAEIHDHMRLGTTTVSRAWSVTRRDGEVFGFTDHDEDLAFEGIEFRAATGLEASSLEQSTGLAVDNVEAIGILSDVSVREDDIFAGRFDGAEVVAWMVNWAKPSERSVLFRGTIGEIRRSGESFTADLRGLSQPLNLPKGRVFQKPCSAVLGDATCRFDVGQPGFVSQRLVEEIEESRVFRWEDDSGFEPGWFQQGRLIVENGAAAGLNGIIKRDMLGTDGVRSIELWEPLAAVVVAGNNVRLEAGCDKRFETCRYKFLNHLNFQGFPDIPGEDWMASYPRRSGGNTGGSLR